MEALEDQGITVADYAEYGGWTEAFVSTWNATRMLFQLMEYTRVPREPRLAAQGSVCRWQLDRLILRRLRQRLSSRNPDAELDRVCHVRVAASENRSQSHGSDDG